LSCLIRVTKGAIFNGSQSFKQPIVTRLGYSIPGRRYQLRGSPV
jgi:hypothetical protein